MTTEARKPFPFPAPAVALALAAAACSGGSLGDGSHAGALARTTAGASIVSPLALGMTTEEFVTVRGTAELLVDRGARAPDHEAVPPSIAAVRVGGAEATSTDGFATWRARVPVAVGRTVVGVEVVDGGGVVHRASARVEIERRVAPLEQPRALCALPDAYYLHDGGREHGGRVLRIGRVSGERAQFASDHAFDPSVLAHDSTRDRLLTVVVAAGAGGAVASRIVAIDRFGGQQQVVYTVAGEVAGLAYDSTHDRVLVVHDGILAVHPTDGTSFQLTAADGWRPLGVAFDPFADRIVATAERAAGGPAIFEVHPVTGGRTVIADESTGTGPALDGLGARIAVDSLQRRAYYVAAGRLCRLDLFTLERREVRTAAVADFAFDAVSRRLVAADGDALATVDPETGDVTELYREPFGRGPRLVRPGAAAVDESSSRLLVLDAALPGVVAVALGTAERMVLSSPERGRGPALEDLRAIAIDATRPRAIVADAARAALFEVDLASGDRQVLADADLGDGPPLSDPRALAIWPAHDEVLWLGTELLAVDPVSGDRRLIADLRFVEGTAMASDGARAFVVGGIGVVHVVDLDTGAVRDVQVRPDFERGDGASRTAEDFTYLCGARGIAVDPVRRVGYVLDQALGGPMALYALELDTGLFSLRSGSAPGLAEVAGGGPRAWDARSLCLDPRSGTLCAIDAHWRAVLHLDPETGERSIATR